MNKSSKNPAKTRPNLINAQPKTSTRLTKKPANKKPKTQVEANTRGTADSKTKDRTINKILLTIFFTTIVIVAIFNIKEIISLFHKKNLNNQTTIRLSKEQLQDSKKNLASGSIQDNAKQDSSSPNKATENTNTGAPENSTNPDTAINNQTQNEIDTSKANTQASASIDTTNTQNLTIFFIKITNDSKISMISKIRTIKKNPAILTNTLQELLRGPSPEETQLGLNHYIPRESKLISAKVIDGVANLDFNDAFQYNELGTAGTLAQLYQIVYTCTEIPSIKSVQITINKQKIKFLGGEGQIEVDRPLTREYLKRF